MAKIESTTQLYSATTLLSYTVTGAAERPRIPFTVADRPKLIAYGDLIADEARLLRVKSPASLRQAAVDKAFQSVSRAQAMFDALNNNISSNLTAVEIFEQLDVAIAHLQSV